MRDVNTAKPVMNGETHEKLMRLTNIVKWLKSLCGEAPELGYITRVLFLCPHIGETTPHIPKSLGSGSGGQLPVRDRGNGLKTQPVVYHWTKGVGWVTPTSYELMRMKVVNHKPVNHLEGNPHPSGWGGGQVLYQAEYLPRVYYTVYGIKIDNKNINFLLIEQLDASYSLIINYFPCNNLEDCKKKIEKIQNSLTYSCRGKISEAYVR